MRSKMNSINGAKSGTNRMVRRSDIANMRPSALLVIRSSTSLGAIYSKIKSDLAK